MPTIINATVNTQNNTSATVSTETSAGAVINAGNLVDTQTNTNLPKIQPVIVLNLDGGIAETEFNQSSVYLSGGAALLVLDATIPLADGGFA